MNNLNELLTSYELPELVKLNKSIDAALENVRITSTIPELKHLIGFNMLLEQLVNKPDLFNVKRSETTTDSFKLGLESGMENFIYMLEDAKDELFFSIIDILKKKKKIKLSVNAIIELTSLAPSGKDIFLIDLIVLMFENVHKKTIKVRRSKKGKYVFSSNK